MERIVGRNHERIKKTKGRKIERNNTLGFGDKNPYDYILSPVVN